MARFSYVCAIALILLMAVNIASPDKGPVDLVTSLLDPKLPLPKDTPLESHILDQAKEIPSKMHGFIAFVRSLTTAPVDVDKLAETNDRLSTSFSAIKQINEKVRINIAVVEKLPRDDCFFQVASELGNQANISNTLIDQVQDALKCHLADKCYRSVNNSVLKTKTACGIASIATTKFYEVVGRCLSQMPAASERLQKAAPELIGRLSISLAYNSLVAEFINAPLCGVYSAKFSWPIEPQQWRQTIIAQLILGGTTPKPPTKPTTTTIPPKVLPEPKCAVEDVNFAEAAPVAAADRKKCMEAFNIISANIFQVSLSPMQHAREQIVLAGATIILQISRLMMMTNPTDIAFSDEGKPNTILQQKALRPSAVQVSGLFISNVIAAPFRSIWEHFGSAAQMNQNVLKPVADALQALSKMTPSMIRMGVFSFDSSINNAIQHLQQGTELLGKTSGNFENILTLIEELHENIALSHSMSVERLATLREQHKASMKRVAEDTSNFNRDFQEAQGHLKAIESGIDALVSDASGRGLAMAIELRNDLAKLADSSIPWPAISQSFTNPSPGSIDGPLAGKLGDAIFGIVFRAYDLFLSSASSVSVSSPAALSKPSGTSDGKSSEPRITELFSSTGQSNPATTGAVMSASAQAHSPTATTRKPPPKTNFTKSLDKFISLMNNLSRRLGTIEKELPYVEVDPESSNSVATVSNIACRAKHFALVGTNLWNKPPLSGGLPLQCQRTISQRNCEKNRVGLEVLYADILAAEGVGKRYTSDASRLMKSAEAATYIDLKTSGVENALIALEEIVSAVGEIDVRAARLASVHNALSTVFIFSIQHDVQWIKNLRTFFKGMPPADQEATLEAVVTVLKEKLNRASDLTSVMVDTASGLRKLWHSHVTGLLAGIIKWTTRQPTPGEDPNEHLNSAIEAVKKTTKTQQDGLNAKIKDANEKIETVAGIIGKPTQSEKEFVANALR